MAASFRKPKHLNPRINYRGLEASRIDNLTDAVFGIAITLLIFNLENPNSFDTLLGFTKTLPAFLISIAFIVLIWKEHLNFSRIYAFGDSWLLILNTIFIGLIIFYVYPLRFLTLFLTGLFFGSDLSLELSAEDIPDLMLYYGLIVSALYSLLFLLHLWAWFIRDRLDLNDYEIWFTKKQLVRLAIMLAVPLVSVIVVSIIRPHSIGWAGVLGGSIYYLYMPAMIIWSRRFKKSEALKFNSQ